MKQTYLLLIPICAASFACSHPAPQLPVAPRPIVMPIIAQPQPSTPIPHQPQANPRRTVLQEIKLDTDLSTVGAPMDWIQIFSAISFRNARSSSNLGFSQRVASFSSANELKADSLQRLKLIAEVPTGKKSSLADEMVKRATSQVNFASHDLIAVYLTDGGPPFGEYRYSLMGDTMEFCIDKAPNPTGISGMALNNIVKFYAAPKGLKVRQCGREL